MVDYVEMKAKKLQDAEVAADALERLVNSQAAPKADVALATKTLDDAVQAYNDLVTEETQAECLAAEKPFLHALKRGYQDKLVVKTKIDGKTEFRSYDVEVDEDRDYVDIVLLSKSVDANDNSWLKFYPTFATVVGYAIGKALNDDTDAKCTRLVKAHREVGPDHVGSKRVTLWDKACISEDADSMSVGSLKKMMTALAVMLLGDDAPKMNGSDARMMLMFGTKEGKKNKYRVPRDVTVLKLLQKALHVRLNGLSYDEDKGE